MYKNLHIKGFLFLFLIVLKHPLVQEKPFSKKPKGTLLCAVFYVSERAIVRIMRLLKRSIQL